MKSTDRTFSKRKHQQFKEMVWAYYGEHKRADLSWRKTVDPYRVVVSELMLQQTQVVRVIPKFRDFIKRFPNTKQLAVAPLADVLRHWQGLGYNRRAKYLHQCAQIVHNQHGGRWPKTISELELLPGIGSYTAAAIVAFAYNQPAICVETNIRTAVIYHYFPDDTRVSEKELRIVVSETLDVNNTREWYWALMDFGAFIKRTHGNRSRQSRSYTKQSSFKGSDREIRGAIIRTLTERTSATVKELCGNGFSKQRVTEQCRRLCREGLIQQVGTNRFSLRS